MLSLFFFWLDCAFFSYAIVRLWFCRSNPIPDLCSYYTDSGTICFFLSSMYMYIHTFKCTQTSGYHFIILFVSFFGMRYRISVFGTSVIIYFVEHPQSVRFFVDYFWNLLHFFFVTTFGFWYVHQTCSNTYRIKKQAPHYFCTKLSKHILRVQTFWKVTTYSANLCSNLSKDIKKYTKLTTVFLKTS